MVERRAGGETGIARVEWIEAEAIWEWMSSAAGQWSRPLLEEAARRNPFRKPVRLEEEARRPVLFRLEYKDGFRAAGLIISPSGTGWSFACKGQGATGIDSTFFGLADKGRPLPHFDGLVKCIEDMFVTGKPVYPVERTLLTTGALALLFQSRKRKQALETPELAIAYRAAKDVYFQRS
jgi:hypothetical protein